jgi:predicted glycoside hydrolase/deacetylase ChbG (UPF0249 family)
MHDRSPFADLTSRSARLGLGDLLLPFDLGVHLNLTQGRPLTGRCYPAALLDRRCCFAGIGRTAALLLARSKRFESNIRSELRAQIERVLASNVSVTHFNGHQYIELVPLVGDLMIELALQYGIHVLRLPGELDLWRSCLARRGAMAAFILAMIKRGFSGRLARRLNAAGLKSPTRFFGTAHAGHVSLNVVTAFLQTTQRNTDRAVHFGEPGYVEIGLHPAALRPQSNHHGHDQAWYDPLHRFRPNELQLLCGRELPTLLRMANARLGRLSQLAASGLDRSWEYEFGAKVA